MDCKRRKYMLACLKKNTVSFLCNFPADNVTKSKTPVVQSDAKYSACCPLIDKSSEKKK